MKKKIFDTPVLLQTYLDGLDAAIDGRGWNHIHEAAKDELFSILTHHKQLLSAAENARNVLAALVVGQLKKVTRKSPALLELREAIKNVRGE